MQQKVDGRLMVGNEGESVSNVLVALDARVLKLMMKNEQTMHTSLERSMRYV